MDIRNKYFPYPVLSNFSDDYSTSGFIFDAELVKDINDIIFKFSVALDNKELLDLIKNEKAEFVFHIECSQTYYRNIAATSETEVIHRIPENKLSNKVTVCSFIVAREDISNYKNDSFHEDYEGISFNIERGNILAIGGQMDFKIIKEAEELSKVPSIFSILRRDTNDDIGMEIDINDDKIKLWLSNEDFINYQILVKRPNLQPSIHAMMIFPALMLVFEKIKNNGIEEYEDFKWFQAINRILKKSGITLDRETIDLYQSFILAQKLLDLPINRAFKGFTAIDQEDDEI